MMVKKKKSSPHNKLATVPVTNQAVEINYEKLADAIVAANEKAKSSASNTTSRELMKFILTPFLYAVSFLCAVISIGFFVLAVQSINNAISLSTISLSLLGDFSKFLLAGLLALFMIALALFSLFSAKELSNETDRDYVASLFSNVVSFAALIIALVALLREVL